MRRNTVTARLTDTRGLPVEVRYAYVLWMAVAVLGVLLSILNSLILSSLIGSAATAVVGITIAVAFGLLYIFLAVRMKDGANWARIALTVLAAMNLLVLFTALISEVTAWIAPLAALIAGVLMWLPGAQPWFKARPTAN